jgi:manganese/zinc/iron transport system permease protein
MNILFYCVAHHYTLCITLVGTALLGITCGALGVFAVLRKQSLLGDTISHAALPGIAGALLLTSSGNPLLLLGGGALSGALAMLACMYIQQTTSLKIDTILGIVLSVFFGFGLVLITVIQKQPIPHQAVINKFLFGSAATLLPSDLYLMSSIGCIILASILLWWRSFTLCTFDPSYAHTLGYNVRIIDITISVLLVLTIVIGLQTVGVILMSSLLIAPAAAARQWTQNLRTMTLSAAAIGACASIIGSYMSSWYACLPTGPCIVVVLSICVFVSLSCAPRRII